MNRTEPPTPRQAAEAMDCIERRCDALDAAGLAGLADGMRSDAAVVRARLDALESEQPQLRDRLAYWRERARYHGNDDS